MEDTGEKGWTLCLLEKNTSADTLKQPNLRQVYFLCVGHCHNSGFITVCWNVRHKKSPMQFYELLNPCWRRDFWILKSWVELSLPHYLPSCPRAGKKLIRLNSLAPWTVQKSHLWKQNICQLFHQQCLARRVETPTSYLPKPSFLIVIWPHNEQSFAGEPLAVKK